MFIAEWFVVYWVKYWESLSIVLPRATNLSTSRYDSSTISSIASPKPSSCWQFLSWPSSYIGILRQQPSHRPWSAALWAKQSIFPIGWVWCSCSARIWRANPGGAMGDSLRAVGSIARLVWNPGWRLQFRAVNHPRIEGLGWAIPLGMQGGNGDDGCVVVVVTGGFFIRIVFFVLLGEHSENGPWCWFLDRWGMLDSSSGSLWVFIISIPTSLSPVRTL